MKPIIQLAAVFIAITCSIADAQRIAIQPRPSGESVIYEGNVIIDADVHGLPENSFSIQVVLQLGDAVFDITDLATISVSSATTASFNSAADILTFHTHGTICLEARYGSLFATTYFNNTGAFEDWGQSEPGLSPLFIAQASSESVPRELLAQRTVDFLTGLDAAGVPVQRLDPASHGAPVWDDRHAFGKSGISTRVTETFTLSVKGRFIPKGWHWNLLQDPAMGPFIRSDQDVIVLNAQICDLIAQSMNNLLGDSGPVNPAGYILLDELIRAAVHQAGTYDAIEADSLKSIIEKIVKYVVPAMKTIHQLLQKPFDQWGQNDVIRLRNTVAVIRQGLGSGSYDSMRDLWGDDAVDGVLDAIDWHDSDKNGLPDWLEQKLRDAGLDPDNLPETPADLPGRTPPLPGGDRPPGEFEPVPEPEIAPVDPNG